MATYDETAETGLTIREPYQDEAETSVAADATADMNYISYPHVRTDISVGSSTSLSQDYGQYAETRLTINDMTSYGASISSTCTLPEPQLTSVSIGAITCRAPRFGNRLNTKIRPRTYAVNLDQTLGVAKRMSKAILKEPIEIPCTSLSEAYTLFNYIRDELGNELTYVDHLGQARLGYFHPPEMIFESRSIIVITTQFEDKQ
jgi:hypothetical protein